MRADHRGDRSAARKSVRERAALVTAFRQEILSAVSNPRIASVGAGIVLSAVTGWLIFVVAARELGPGGYAEFSVMWGLFFGLGGVFSGMQQEITRAISIPDPDAQETRMLRGVFAVLIPYAALVLISSLWWGSSTLGSRWHEFMLPFTVGLGLLAGLNAVNGALAAHGRWTLLGTMIGGDQVLRLALVVLVLVVSREPVTLMWAVAGGTLVWAPLSMTPAVRRALTVQARFRLEGFVRRSAAAMASTGSAALLISGFPFLVEVTTREPLGESAGVVFAAIIVARSPLLLPLYGFRPVLVSWLISRRLRLVSTLHSMLVVGAGVGVSAALVAYIVGPFVVRLAFGSAYEASGAFVAGLTLGAALLMLLTITGIGLIVADRHSGSTRGWFVALAATCLVLALPSVSLEPRVCIAMVAGPALGVAWHLAELRRGGDRA
jgi:O-antigen/teichoic acid export membrane protein